jgi:hypothetical protein
MTIDVRVIQRGQPTQGEMRSAYDYVYRPFLTSTVQPPITPDYGAWAARNSRLLNGVGNAGWRAGRPMAPTAAPVWRGVGGSHQPRQAMFAPAQLPVPQHVSMISQRATNMPYSPGPVQVQQSSGASRHVPSSQTVVRDAFQQPHSRAPRLYGPSLGQALGDVYRW